MINATQKPDEWVAVGKIAGVYGVRGWVKLYSYTDPRDALLDYQPWFLGAEHQETKLVDSRAQGKGLVGQLAGLDDRDAALALVNTEIFIRRQQLPENREGSYYWTDLIGLQVENLQGVDFGKVDHLMETGSNDVLVVQGDRQRLVPFILDQVIQQVDLSAGVIRVDWDPDF